MSRRVLVVEALCAGGVPGPNGEPAPASWRVEGRAMLAAVTADLAACDDLRVTALWDHRAGPPPHVPGVTWQDRSNAPFITQVSLLAACHERTLLIAPETDGLLANLVAEVEHAGARTTNSSVDAIRLTTDKLWLARHLAAHAVPTIPTRAANTFDPTTLPAGWSFPLVIKPVDGAGSLGVRRLESLADWNPAAISDNDIVQPWIAGEALSMAVLIDHCGPGNTVCLPPARQWLSTDGHCAYLGGEIPATGVDVEVIEFVARAAVAAVPGLRRYVGLDLIWPQISSQQTAATPVVCEINPRLTTSYVGYRELYGRALTRSLMLGEPFQPKPITDGVHFTAAGEVSRVR